MNLVSYYPQVDLLPEEAPLPGEARAVNDKTVGSAVTACDEVRTQVWGVLTTLYPNYDLAERRSGNRYPFPYLVHLTPVGEDGISPEGKTFVVVGKHLSERGFGFYHPAPLPHRRMIVSMETESGEWIAFLVDLSWCRFTKQGWYESGGRFLQSVLSPVASTIDSLAAG